MNATVKEVLNGFHLRPPRGIVPFQGHVALLRTRAVMFARSDRHSLSLAAWRASSSPDARPKRSPLVVRADAENKNPSSEKGRRFRLG